jgi:hypothetical protein
VCAFVQIENDPRVLPRLQLVGCKLAELGGGRTNTYTKSIQTAVREIMKKFNLVSVARGSTR